VAYGAQYVSQFHARIRSAEGEFLNPKEEHLLSYPTRLVAVIPHSRPLGQPLGNLASDQLT
jgi:hypothetical protein